jgi:hypothetical protein
MNGGTTMLTKTCIAAAVALGCVLAVPGGSFAAGDNDKSATATASPKAPASKPNKKHKKKGYADDINNYVNNYQGRCRGVGCNH